MKFRLLLSLILITYLTGIKNVPKEVAEGDLRKFLKENALPNDIPEEDVKLQRIQREARTGEVAVNVI